MNPKVLIGCPTYDKQKFCVDRFLEAVKQLTYSNLGLIIIDNSETDEYSKLLRSKDVEAVWKPPQAEDRIGKIVESRKAIIKIFLNSDYEYLFFLDTDIVAPPDVVERLLKHDNPIMTGVYGGWQKVGNKPKICPIIFDFTDNKEYTTFIPLNKVVGDSVFEIFGCGFGCCLIKREVLEKIEISYNKGKGGEDVMFCYNARNEFGFKTFVDTSIKCIHMTEQKDIVIPETLPPEYSIGVGGQ